MIYRKVLLMLSSFLFSVFCIAQKKEVQIVLLGGQSNMAGHGSFKELDKASLIRLEKAKQHVLLSASNPKKDAVPLGPYNGGKNKKYDFKMHFGPELFSGIVMSEKYPNQEFLFIKKAVGGTSLYGAWNTNWTKEKAAIAERGDARKKMKLYSEHINNIKINLQQLEEKGIAYKIVGMLWMQGESDTNSELKATHYEANLKELISSYRKEFGIKDLPFVFGQINVLPRKFKEGPAIVRKAMEHVANADKNVSLIKTVANKPWNDFPKHSDNTHYNTEGQKRLGTAFGEALYKLIN